MKNQFILIHALLGLVIQIHGSNSDEQYLSNEKIEDTDYEKICFNRNITVDFSGLSLTRIKSSFLSSPMVTCLDLKSNGIDEISKDAFSNLPNLKYLNLEDNYFDLNNLFSNELPNIETLILNNNYQRQYNSEISVNVRYPKLKKLFLKNDFHKQYSVYFKSQSNDIFPALTHADLSGSYTREDDFSWLPNTLEYLDLSGHRLPSLTLKGLNNLERLFLDNPAEKNLQSINFENLSKLKYLSIPSNKISEINTQTFINTNSLLYLDVSDNNIQNIESGSFDSMQNLQFLNLSNNNIDIIAAGTFDNLKNLKVLVLEKNSISSFPMIGVEMKLEKLTLNCNRLKGIIGGTFMMMPLLESLYLHNNELSYIDQQAFKGLNNLKNLTLSNNQLSSLPSHWMSPLTSLQNLDLAGNYFQTLADLSFSDNCPVKNIYLSSQLMAIQANLVYTIPENSTISLDPSFSYIKPCDQTGVESTTSGYYVKRRRYG